MEEWKITQVHPLTNSVVPYHTSLGKQRTRQTIAEKMCGILRTWSLMCQQSAAFTSVGPGLF
jgi:hypothetical protein